MLKDFVFLSTKNAEIGPQFIQKNPVQDVALFYFEADSLPVDYVRQGNIFHGIFCI
jgi:hypothetical protein